MMDFVEPRSKNHVEFTFSKFNVIFGFATKEKFSNVCNFIVLMAKWEIWKERNIVKYQKKNSTCFTMFKRFQWNVINYINIVLLAGTCKQRNGKNEKKRKEAERKKTKRKQGEK